MICMTLTSSRPATRDSYVPSRRTVLRAAAWTAPAVSVAVAVPAYAACSPASTKPSSYALSWGSGVYTRASAASGTAVVPGAAVGAQPVSVVVTSSVSSSRVNRNAQNLLASSQGLELHHASPIVAGRDHRQTVTFTFSRSVSGLTFSIKDVDSSQGGWWDRVELTGARKFEVAPRGRRNTHILGSGVQGAPWYYYDSDTVLPNSGDSRGTVTVTYTEPVSSISLVYWTSVGGSNQRIWLSDFSFTASSC
jgi:hypothetical protein